MLRWLLKNRLAAFERTYGYDTSYMREMVDDDPRAVLAFAKIQKMGGYRKDVALDVWFAVKLTGSMAEDCGPCTQLGVAMALRAGVAPATIAAVVRGDDDALPEDVRLGVRFARAALAHSPDADEPRDEIVRRWGRRALISLAFAMTSARVYPSVKYALGHGRACQRVDVAGETVAVVRAIA